VARISLVFLLTLGAVSLTAQDQPTFRTGANYVRVDMYATRDGKPVEDLKAPDIEILEDGVLQTIDAFEYVKVRTGTPQESRVEPTGIEQSRQMAGNARARVFVIFLDTYHTQIEGSANMRQPLINFIDRVLGPDDLVALMTPEMAASEITFGRKTTVITNLLQREWLWGRRGRLRGTDNDEREDLYDACYPALSSDRTGISAEMKARRREKLTLDALEDLMVHVGGLREERKAVLAVTEGWRLYPADATLARRLGDEQALTPGDVLGRPPRPRPSDTGQVQGSIRVQCEADRMALAQLDHQLRLRELTQDANRGNVTFYPVYARGLVAFDSPIGPDPPPSLAEDAASLRARHDSLRELADGTDGTSVINTNNIDAALRRIADDLSSYYLMGYYTTNTKLDGRFRSLTVRVKRDGVRVRARKGYRGYSPGEISRGAAAPLAPAAAAAVTAVMAPVVSFNARAQFRIRAASWSGGLWVVGELDPQTRRQAAWSSEAQADVAVILADGTQAATRRFDVKPADGAFVVQVPESGRVPPGDYTVRLRLRSPVSGELGLSDSARVSIKEDSPLGDAVLWRRGPSTGPQFLRTADPRFQRTERIRLELATSSSEPAAARLIDRNGQPMSVPLSVSERAESSSDFKWLVVELALAPFGAGDYALEVTQGQGKQLTAFRMIP
jgi:VWFA-related protein